MGKEQNIQFLVNHSRIQINNPSQEIHVAILQNENWKSAITKIRPQFYKPNQLVYNYTNKTNFLGGNEYLFFDNKNIRNASVSIARSRKNDVWNFRYD